MDVARPPITTVASGRSYPLKLSLRITHSRFRLPQVRLGRVEFLSGTGLQFQQPCCPIAQSSGLRRSSFRPGYSIQRLSIVCPRVMHFVTVKVCQHRTFGDGITWFNQYFCDAALDVGPYAPGSVFVDGEFACRADRSLTAPD